MFYRIHRAYIKWGESDIPGLYALGIITILQSFIAIGFFGIIAKLVSDPPYLNKYYAGGFALVLLFFNYWLLYKKKGKNYLIGQWENEPSRYKKQMDLLMFLHFILSVGLMAIAIAM